MRRISVLLLRAEHIRVLRRRTESGEITQFSLKNQENQALFR